MCTHNLCFEQKKKEKNITIFHLEIIIFTAEKNGSIFSRRVFIMQQKKLGAYLMIFDDNSKIIFVITS